MKVSVVIPAYNEEKYIQKTLEAVSTLDYPDFEIIVVDNNSTDQTATIVQTFPQVKLVRELNKGTQFTRERGRKEAQGEIIACIDADCTPSSNWLTIGLKKLKNQNIVAVSGPYDYYDGTKSFRYSSLLIQKYLYKITHIFMQLFGFGGIMIAGNSLIRASALEKIGGYDTSYTFYGDDTDTAKRLSKIGKLSFYNAFIMKTSARRFEREGLLKIMSLYFYYFIKTVFTHSK